MCGGGWGERTTQKPRSTLCEQFVRSNGSCFYSSRFNHLVCLESVCELFLPMFSCIIFFYLKQKQKQKQKTRWAVAKHL